MSTGKDKPATSDSARRVEIVARALYRFLMDEDYAEFPWDDGNEPSSETVDEARCLAAIAVRALDGEYSVEDDGFRRAVDDAARERLQELVRALAHPPG